MKIYGSLALKLCLCLVATAALAAAGTSLVLTATPSAVDFAYTSPQPLPMPVVVTVAASDGSSPAITLQLTPPTGAAATLFPVPIPTGDSFQVGYDVNTLNSLVSHPATYTATITVSADGFQPLSVPVTFVIGGTLSVTPSPATLTFNSPAASYQQTVQLSGTGGAAVGFTASVATTTGGQWLSLTANASHTPATLTVTVDPQGLAGGSYYGSITIVPESGPETVVLVTLQIGVSTLTANPTSVAFSYTLGGTTPPAQAVQLSTTLSNDTYVAQAASTGGWLLLNGVTTQISGTLPASVNVTINPAALAAGNYQGTINVSGSDGSTVSVTVTLVVSGISNVANPTSLVFVAQHGGAPPAAQTVAINGFGAATYTATVNAVWLSISSTHGAAPTQITVSVNPTGLDAGTYSGQVQINLNTHIQNIQVIFTISANPVLTTNTGTLVFSYFGGSFPPPPVTLNVSSTSGASQSFAFAPGLPDWLQVTSAANNLVTPAQLTVTLTPQILATGTYLAQIILTPSTAGGISIVVPVLLVVTGATPVVPSVTSLTFSGAANGSPQSQTIEVTASSTTAFTTSTSVVGNVTWLTVSPGSGVANLGGTPVTVTADPTNLLAGTYHGTVSLTTAGGVVSQVAVAFTVTSGGGGLLTITPSILAFTYTQNGALPAAQTLQISGSQSFTDSASTTTGGPWLAVTPVSGTGNTTLSVSVNPVGVAAGQYSGIITVTPSGGSPQTVPVTLTVSSPIVTATPNSLTFSYLANSPPPAAQTVSITSGSAIAFTALASGGGWLSVTPTSATTPATLSVSVNPTDLIAGPYAGMITLSGSSGTALLTINVALSVTSPLPIIDRVTNAASYLTGGISPGEIVTIFGTSLGPTPGAGATINKGYIGTTLAGVQATFNGYPGPMLYAGAGQINTIVPYEVAGSSNVAVEVLFGTARSNVVTLSVVSTAPGIFSADASGKGGGAILDLNYNLVSASNPVSAGNYIQVFATGQGQTSPPGVDGLIEPLTFPLPGPLAASGVTIGGIPATIQYIGAAPGLVAGALQVNVKIPDGVPSGPAPLFLSFGGATNSQTGITVAIK